MTDPGFYTDTHWRYAIDFVDDAGAPLPLTGRTFAVEVYRGHELVFSFDNAQDQATNGSIDESELASGRIIIDATEIQHEAVTPGFYSWECRETIAIDDHEYSANGQFTVAEPGGRGSSFRVANASDGATASAALVALKGDKGDKGDTGDKGDPGAGGPVPVTLSAGTNTAYVGTAALNPADGVSFLFTPDVDNGGSATLKLNGGTARSLRDASGSALVKGMLKAGREYIAVFHSNNVFRVSALRPEIDAFGNITIYGSGGRFVSLKANYDDAAPVSRFFLSNDGHIDFSTEGATGITNPNVSLRVQTDGRARSFFGFLDNLFRVFSSSFPQSVAESVGTMQEPLAGVREGGDTDPVEITTTEPMFVDGALQPKRRAVWVNGVAAQIDLQAMRPHSRQLIEVEPGSSANLYCGVDNSWPAYADKRVAVAADSIVEVIKAQSRLHLNIIRGSASTDATALPARTRSIAFIGQSWPVRWATQAGLSGMQRGLGELGLSRSLWPINAAVGASALLKGDGIDGSPERGAADPDNYWWDIDAHAPGPNATAALAAIAARPAGQPAPTTLIWWQGITDAIYMSTAGLFTRARYRDALLELIAWIRAPAQLNDATLPVMVVPIGGEDDDSTINGEGGYSCVRIAQLQAVASGTNMYQGPEVYDASRRWRDVHPDFAGMDEIGWRAAAHLDNAWNAASNWLGPTITSFAESNSKTFVVTIDRGPGVLGFWRPLAPAGFALLPAGSEYVGVTPYEINRYSWSADVLTITTAVAASGARLVYPWGVLAEARDVSRVIRQFDSNRPLRTSLPS